MRNIMCSVTLILMGFLSMPLYAQQKDHLVALYSCDNESGNGVIDSSGNGNNGIFQGGVKRANGKFKGGLEFNGKDAFIEIPDSKSLTITDGLTVSIWIYLRNYSSAGGTGFTKGESYKFGTCNTKQIELRSTTAGGAWASNVVYGGTTFPLNEWHHIAGTYDAVSGNVIIYLDGKEDGSGKLSGNITPKTDVAWIGRGAAPFFDGVYDEVAVWNVPLSQSEILQAMQAISPIEPSGKLTATWGEMKSGNINGL